MYGLLVEPQSFPFGTYICPQSKKTVKNGSKFHGKFAVFCYYLARNDKLGDRNKCQRSSGKSFMKIGYSEVPKPSYLPLLWPAVWKMTAPLATIKPIIYIRRENNFLTKTKGILSTNKANSNCDTIHSICCRMSLEVFLKVVTFDFLENLRFIKSWAP